MAWKTLDDMDLTGKRVLTRVDINVPVEDGVVTDATRIERIKPTVDAIVAAGGTPILLAHFGRPKGEGGPGDVALSYCAKKCLKCWAGTSNSSMANTALPLPGSMPVRLFYAKMSGFNPGEEANDEGFAERLASLGDIYCNDAFSAAHRAHASTEALAKLLPACAGPVDAGGTRGA